MRTTRKVIELKSRKAMSLSLLEEFDCSNRHGVDWQIYRVTLLWASQVRIGGEFAFGEGGLQAITLAAF